MSRVENVIQMYGGGRLGNQLLLHVHLLANALEFPEIRFYNYSLFPYKELFDLSVHESLIHRHHINPLLEKLFTYFQSSRSQNLIGSKTPRLAMLDRILKNLPMVTFDNLFSEEIRGRHQTFKKLDYLFWKSFSTKSVFLAGYRYRNWSLVEKHYRQIITEITICNNYTDVSRNVIKDLRVKNEVIIGLFIRRGDYKSWLQGKYFFELEEYKKILSDLIQSCYPRKLVQVHVASDDESVTEFCYKNGYTVCSGTARKGHFVQNIIELSLCDIIISPPSTFSGMAAFLGNKPIYPFYTKNQIFDSKDIFKNHLFDAHKNWKFNDSVC